MVRVTEKVKHNSVSGPSCFSTKNANTVFQVIDVERNPNFNCSSLSQYDQIKIVSDCNKNISEISRVPRIFRPTRDCDIACQAEKHYKALHKYVLDLWKILKQKYENFNLDVEI
ncbi:hypothetical protein COOONC_15758 [Cooperia oncophora]